MPLRCLQNATETNSTLDDKEGQNTFWDAGVSYTEYIKCALCKEWGKQEMLLSLRETLSLRLHTKQIPRPLSFLSSQPKTEVHTYVSIYAIPALLAKPHSVHPRVTTRSQADAQENQFPPACPFPPPAPPDLRGSCAAGTWEVIQFNPSLVTCIGSLCILTSACWYQGEEEPLSWEQE